MRFLGLIITLAAVGYAVHMYLDSSTDAGSQAEQYIDHSSEAADAMNRALQQQRDVLNSAN